MGGLGKEESTPDFLLLNKLLRCLYSMHELSSEIPVHISMRVYVRLGNLITIFYSSFIIWWSLKRKATAEAAAAAPAAHSIHG